MAELHSRIKICAAGGSGGMEDNMSEFEGKVVVVTGGSEGIGLQIVKEYAKRNAKVAMVALRNEKIKEAIASAGVDKDNIKGFPCDLSVNEEIEKMAQSVLKEFGHVDILVNNVGSFSEKIEWDDIDDETWIKAFETNTLSAYYCTKYFAEDMIRKGINGSIVTTGSSTALQLKRGRLHYTVTKSALHTMMQVLAIDLARNNIRVNVVSPGPTATEKVQARIDDPSQAEAEIQRLKKIPMGRYANPVDIANAVLFLSSSKAGFITGAVLPVDGGYTIGEPY